MVAAKKSGGDPGDIQWAIDYREINNVTISNSYTILNVDEILEKLAGTKVYSSLDAVANFHIIPVEESSRPLLAYITLLWASLSS